MSSIYKHLTKADLKLEKEKPVLIPGEGGGVSPLSSPRLWGIKIAIIVAFLISFAAFSVSLYLLQSLSRERQERETIENAYMEFGKETQIIKSESRQYRDEIARMREQLKKYADERGDMTKELNRSRIEISNLEKKIKSLEDYNQKMKIELEKYSQRLLSEPTNGALQVAGPAASAAVMPLQDAGPKPLAAVAEVPAAAPPVQSPAVQEIAVPAQDGVKQVMTVNRKFNFVVMNLGLRDQLRIGDRLYIEHEGKRIAAVDVEKLYDNFAAATIVDEDKNVKIQEGDAVRKA